MNLTQKVFESVVMYFLYLAIFAVFWLFFMADLAFVIFLLMTTGSSFPRIVYAYMLYELKLDKWTVTKLFQLLRASTR